MIEIITTIYNKKQEISALKTYKRKLDTYCVDYMKIKGNHNKYPYVLWEEENENVMHKLSKEDVKMYSPTEYLNIYKDENDYYSPLTLNGIKWLYSKFNKIVRENDKYKKKYQNRKNKQIHCNIIEIKQRYRNKPAYIKISISDGLAQKILNGDVKDLKLCYKE